MALPPSKELVFCITFHKSIHAGHDDEWCIWLRVDGNRFEYYGKSTKSHADAKAKATRIAAKGKRMCSFVSEEEMKKGTAHEEENLLYA